MNDFPQKDNNEEKIMRELVAPIIEERITLFEQYEKMEMHCFSKRFEKKEKKLMSSLSNTLTHRKFSRKMMAILVAALILLLAIPVAAAGRILLTKLSFLMKTGQIYEVTLEVIENTELIDSPKEPTTLPYGFYLKEELYEDGFLRKKYVREGYSDITFYRLPCNSKKYVKYYGSENEEGDIEFVFNIEEVKNVEIGEYQGILTIAYTDDPYYKIAEIRWSDGVYYYGITSSIDHYFNTTHCLPNKTEILIEMANSVE